MPKAKSESISVNAVANPNMFLDALKARLNIKKDVTLSSLLGIEPSRIGKIRSNGRPISAKLLVRMHESTNISLDELKEMFNQPRTRARIDLFKQVSAVLIDESDTRNRYDMSFKLDAVCMVSDSMSPAQVAKHLNLSKSTLHNWVKAYRLGELIKPVALSPEEIDYIQRLLKQRAAGIRQNLGVPKSKQEKGLIAALQKKLHVADSN